MELRLEPLQACFAAVNTQSRWRVDSFFRLGTNGVHVFVLH